MAHVLNASMLAGATGTVKPSRSTKPSFFRRLADAIVESRYKTAMREVRRHQDMINRLSTRTGETSTGSLPFGPSADR